MSQNLAHLDERNNFLVLLCALVLFLFVDALADQLQLAFTQQLVRFALLATLLVNVWVIHSPRTRAIGWKWGATMVILSTMVSDSLVGSGWFANLQLLVAFLFVSLTTWQAWGQVMFTGVVDKNKIVGAICIYLLLGLGWAFAYLITEAFLPGSMIGLGGDTWLEQVHSAVYYSLVTLTTLGYGDITPAQPITRFLAMMEAVTGIFYTTVLVASLVGVRLSGVDARKPIEVLEMEAETRNEA